ncbi:MAG: hypothetical protein ACXU85_18720 [Xanthobacteraceae bacterium]
MSRQAVLSSLIQFDAPIKDLQAKLASFSWDADAVITLMRRDIIAILERFAKCEIDAGAVKEWANLLECREDIRFEPGYEKIIAAAIHDLANPELRGGLADTAPAVFGSLL